MKKTEIDFGREYAESMQGEDGFDSPVDLDKMLGRSVDIPPDDYREMKDTGIINPDARKYWEGFNKYFESQPVKYLLSVDEDTWAQFKSRCALQKLKIKDALAQMIQKFISEV